MLGVVCTKFKFTSSRQSLDLSTIVIHYLKVPSLLILPYALIISDVELVKIKK